MEKLDTLPIPPGAAVVVLTGAGISAESGIPTFREKGGLWEKYDAYRLATPEGFRDDPLRLWQFYSERRRAMITAKPNPAHYALASLETYVKQRGDFLLVTQNVDGLHRLAGSQNIVEIHGNIFRTKCSNPECKGWYEPFDDQSSYMDAVPLCEICGSPLRPDVVWFGEIIDSMLEFRVQQALQACDFFIAVGTSGTVYPAAGYVQLAADAGAETILVNAEAPHNIAYFNKFFQGPAARVLPKLLGTA